MTFNQAQENKCNCKCHKNINLAQLINGLCAICKSNHEIKIIGENKRMFKDFESNDTTITFSRISEELK